MTALPNLVAHLAPVAERYITLLRVHPFKTYNYAKRGSFGLPVIDIERHAPKCKIGESWLYFAIPTSASIAELSPDDRLYVGAQTQDRMFRGDGLDGNNYHHGEMRAGNGSDNPAAFLAAGNQVAIYRVNAHRIGDLVSALPSLHHLRVLADQPRISRKHLGWWYEQYILFSEPSLWRWNTAPADKTIGKLFSGLMSGDYI